MKSATIFFCASLLISCGGVDSTLFGSGAASTSASSGGRGGAPASSSGPAAGNGGASVVSSSSGGAGGSGGASVGPQASSSSSSSSGGPAVPYLKSGVQQNVPASALIGWTECFADAYADNTVSQQQVLTSCPGSKLMMACRPKGSKTLSVLAMGERADVTFQYPANDNTSTHSANGVGWYMSPSSWGFAPAGDPIWKGPMDVTGISPNTPGPDGDKRVSWVGNQGQMWIGYRCGYDCYENHPGFDYDYERVVLSMP